MESNSPGGEGSVLLQLRKATAVQHQRLEDSLDLMAGDLSVHRYGQVLTAFASIYGPLEDRLDEAMQAHPQLAAELNWPQRRKQPALSADLHALGCSWPQPTVQPLPRLNDTADILGAMYVTEGATLGGQYIGPHVTTTLGLQATAFFSSYGRDVASQWAAFRGVLRSRLEANSPASIRAEQAAITTFALFEDAAHEAAARAATDLK